MKKISTDEMISYSGGMKCIYHGVLMFAGLIGVAIGLNGVIECWNGTHQE